MAHHSEPDRQINGGLRISPPVLPTDMCRFLIDAGTHMPLHN